MTSRSTASPSSPSSEEWNRIPYSFYSFYNPNTRRIIDKQRQRSEDNDPADEDDDFEQEDGVRLPYPDPDCLAVATFLKMAKLKPALEEVPERRVVSSSSRGKQQKRPKEDPGLQLASDLDKLSRSKLPRLPLLQNETSGAMIDGGAEGILSELERFVGEQRTHWRSFYRAAAEASAAKVEDSDDEDDFTTLRIETVVPQSRSSSASAAASQEQATGFAAEGILLLEDLSAAQRIQYEAIESVVKKNLYACVLYHWFINEKNYGAQVSDNYRSQTNALVTKLLLPRFVKQDRQSRLKALFLNYRPLNSNMSMVDYFRLLYGTLEMISGVLGSKTYLFSNETPSILDAYAYAYLSCLLYSEFQDNRFSKLLAQHPNLILYCKRISAQYFPQEHIPPHVEFSMTSDCSVENIATTTATETRLKSRNRMFYTFALGSLTTAFLLQHTKVFGTVLGGSLAFLLDRLLQHFPAETTENA